MLQSLPWIPTKWSDIPSLYLYITGMILVYIVYRAFFNGITFKSVGKYNTKLKDIGRPLPSFPNGWYVAIHSHKLQKGKSEAVDVAGENLVVFRSHKGKPYALEAYCKHLGANLGIGGAVVQQKCIQCPFHGWLYDGESGLCVDHNGKPIQGFSVTYNEDFCEKGKKLQWIEKHQKNIKLRKYPVCQLNGYVYVWIHAVQQHQQKPIYPMLDLSPITKDMEFRARAIHQVKCHIQDIPENGADSLHFKYVHAEVVPKLNIINFLWKAKWMKGDNPDMPSLFQHDIKYVRDFKQKIYKQFVQKYPRKQFLGIGNINNYIKLPFFGYKFFVNITIIQLGCSTVFIFLKSPVFTTVLFHYLIPKQKYKQIVYHEGFTGKWVPYWLSALVVKMDESQVTSDMHVWDAKKFMRSMSFKKGQQADSTLKQWTEWYSQHFEGCLQKEKNKLDW